MIADDFGATFNFVISYILFFGFGYPAYEKFGYDDNSPPDSTGPYLSGTYGSGVFAITAALFVVANSIWLIKMIINFRNNTLAFRAEEEANKERIAREVALRGGGK
jgi:hypothetical protein